MATPPTLVAEYENATPWLSGTSPKTASVTTALADVLVVVSGGETQNTAINLPTGGTGTYANAQNVGPAGSFGRARADTVSAGVTAQTYTLSQDTDSGTTWWGFGVYRFSGSDGIGASGGTNAAGAAPSLTFSTTADNSSIVVVVTDWNATDGTTRTWRAVNGFTPTAGNGAETTYARDASHYTAYVAVYPDAGTAGSKTVGLTAPTGQNFTIAAVEVKGTAGGPATSGPLLTPGMVSVPSTVVGFAGRRGAARSR